MKTRTFIFAVIILFLFSCNFETKTKINLENKTEDTNADTTKILKIGVAAMLSPREALPAYLELIDYLGNKLNIKTEMIFTKNYATMNKLVKTKNVLAAFVCSGPYVKGHDKWGMELIAAPSLYGKPQYYSYIIVNKKSNIYKFEDLKGKKFAFTDPESNTGKLVPTYELAKNGKTPDNFFSGFFYSGSHDKSIEAVAQNLADGAAVDQLIWEYINKYDSTFTSKTRIISKLGPFCIPPFVTYPDCNPELKQKLKSILLSMNNDTEGKIILNKLLIDKFVVVKDNCYQSIREMNNLIRKVK